MTSTVWHRSSPTALDRSLFFLASIHTAQDSPAARLHRGEGSGRQPWRSSPTPMRTPRLPPGALPSRTPFAHRSRAGGLRVHPRLGSPSLRRMPGSGQRYKGSLRRHRQACPFLRPARKKHLIGNFNPATSSLCAAKTAGCLPCAAACPGCGSPTRRNPQRCAESSMPCSSACRIVLVMFLAGMHGGYSFSPGDKRKLRPMLPSGC